MEESFGQWTGKPKQERVARTQEQGCPSPLELSACHHVILRRVMELQELMSALLDFSLALVRFLLAIFLFLPFRMAMFGGHYCLADVCNFVFHFIKAYN